MMPSTLGIKNMVQNGYAAALEDIPGGQEFVDKYKGKLVEFKNTYKGKTYSVPSAVTTRRFK